ncbi:MAG: amidohydrolase [Candidatus Anstonellaceae archaeon]
MSLLIKNATLVSGKKADILIEENKIVAVRPSIKANAEERIDASSKLALPGFVNSHTHCPMTLLRGFAEDMRLEEWLEKVRKKEQNFSPAQVYAGALVACIEMLKSGTTCFSDMYFHMDEVAKAVLNCGIRAVLAYGMVDLGDHSVAKSELQKAEAFISKWNGKANGKIKCAVAPHSIYLCSAELLKESNRLSQKYNLPLHIHLSETRKEVFDCLKATGKRPVFYLNSLRILSKRLIAAHCCWLSKEEVRVLAKSKCSAALCPVSNMKLAGGGVAPLPEMQEFGMNVCLGTDGAASNNSLSMFDTMKVLGLIQKNARWDASIAKHDFILNAATHFGSNALSINAGKIKQGFLADIVLIDLKATNLLPWQNHTANLIYSAHPGNVTDVIVDGRQVVCEGKLLTFDEEKAKEIFLKQVQLLN